MSDTMNIDNLTRATVAAFNATATDEQKRLRDVIAAAYAGAPLVAPPPTPRVGRPCRAAYGSVKDAIIADLRTHPRSTSAEVSKRVGTQPESVANLGNRGVILREPSGRTNGNGAVVYLYSAKESE